MKVSDNSESTQITGSPEDSPETNTPDDLTEQQSAPSNEGRLQDQAAAHGSAKAFFQSKMGGNRDSGKTSQGGDPAAKTATQKAMQELGINPDDVREVADRGDGELTSPTRPDTAVSAYRNFPGGKPPQAGKPHLKTSDPSGKPGNAPPQPTISTPKRPSGNLSGSSAYPQSKQTKTAESALGQMKSAVEVRLPSEKQMQTGSDTMKMANDVYGAGRDVLDLTKDLRNDKVEPKLAELQKKVSEFKSTVARTLEDKTKVLSGIEEKARGVVRNVFEGKMSWPDARRELAVLQNKQTQVLSAMKTCEDMVGKVEGAVHNLRGANKLVGEASETMQSYKNFLQSGKAGKALFGLDAACNFVDLQERDPGNPGKNALQACTMSSSKLLADYGTAAKAAGKSLNRLNVAETAIGVLKFGMNQMGLGDTPEAKMLNAASSAMPVDLFSKNVGMLTDMTVALGKDLISGGGSLKEWERINNDNLEGNNGPLAQASAFLGDAIATGGRNIPKKDTYGIADSLGYFGVADSIPDRIKLAHIPAKARFVDDLMEGNLHRGVSDSGFNEDSIRMRELLTYGPPGQTVDLLKQVDKEKLAKTLDPPERSLPWHRDTMTNGTGLAIDLIHKANSRFTPPETRKELTFQAEKLIKCYGDQGRSYTNTQLRNLLDENKLGNIPDSLRTVIRNLPAWNEYLDKNQGRIDGQLDD